MVTLTGLDGAVYRSRTEADGVFELARVPMGVYAVHYELPPELEAAYNANPQAVTVPSTKGQGEAGCEIGVAVYARGRVSGQVVDTQGHGVEGTLVVSDRAPYGLQAGASTTFGFTGADGFFSVTPLEAGSYWIDFVPKMSKEDHWSYPGTRQSVNAAPVRVEEGKTTEGLVLRIG